MLISVKGTGKKSDGVRPEEYGGCSSILTMFFTKKSLTKPDRCAGALSLGRNKLMVLHFSGAFPTDRIPEATKEVNVHLFIQSSKFCKLYQQIPGTF
jgi:hypothetical protein